MATGVRTSSKNPRRFLYTVNQKTKRFDELEKNVKSLLQAVGVLLFVVAAIGAITIVTLAALKWSVEELSH
jgi:hypothetical protein